jgi:hypothetical protein
LQFNGPSHQRSEFSPVSLETTLADSDVSPIRLKAALTNSHVLVRRVANLFRFQVLLYCHSIPGCICKHRRLLFEIKIRLQSYFPEPDIGDVISLQAGLRIIKSRLE